MIHGAPVRNSYASQSTHFPTAPPVLHAPGCCYPSVLTPRGRRCPRALSVFAFSTSWHNLALGSTILREPCGQVFMEAGICLRKEGAAILKARETGDSMKEPPRFVSGEEACGPLHVETALLFWCSPVRPHTIRHGVEARV